MDGWTELWSAVIGTDVHGQVMRIWTETCYTFTTPDGWTAFVYQISLTLQGLRMGRRR